MTKVHYDDLTAINSPWCLLDADTQTRMEAEPDVQVLQSNGSWVKVIPSWLGIYTYRAKPKPARVVRWFDLKQGSGLFGAFEFRNAPDNYKQKHRICIFRIECDEDGGNPTISREEG